MNTEHELERVRNKVDRLAGELAEVRKELAALEARFAAPPGVSPPAGAQVDHGIPPSPPAVPPPLPACVSRSVSELANDPVAATASETSKPPPLPAFARGAEPRPKSESSSLRTWLERLQLWPPSEDADGGAEARLGAWWTTRIGMVLAVIGVVFFGVYVSRYTPAWVKFVELLAVAGGVCVLGDWLTRKVTSAFGEVVHAGGLALFFFAAYAGHAFPALRVFPELWMSVLAQGVAVACIVGAALRRRSPSLATLAIGLGYVTAGVSGGGGLEGYAMGAGMTLAVVAVWLRRSRGWEGPSVIAVPGAYGVLALGLHRMADAVEVPAAMPIWGYLVGCSVVFYLRDWRRACADTMRVSREEVWFQGASSSLALVCGLWATLSWWRAELAWFYGGAAVLAGIGAWWRARQNGRADTVAAVLLAKATGALTLAVIEVVGARDAAIALLTQAWVLAWTARRTESRVLTGATAIVATLASGYFLLYGIRPTPLWSVGAGKVVVFALGLVLLATEAGRWLLAKEVWRSVSNVGAALVAGVGLIAATSMATPGNWEPTVAFALAVVFAGVAWLRRANAATMCSGMLAAASQLWWWTMSCATNPPGTLAVNAGVLACCLGVVGGLARPRRVAGIAWAFFATGGVLTLFALRPAEQALAISVVGALALGLAASVAPGRRLLSVATLTLLLGVAGWMIHGFVASGVWSLFAVGAAWALPVVACAWPRLNEEHLDGFSPEWETRWQVLAAVILSVVVAVRVFDDAASVFALCASVVMAALAARPVGVEAARTGARCLAGVAALAAAVLILSDEAEAWRPGFFAALTTSVVLAALPWWFAPKSRDRGGFERVVGGALALGLAFMTFSAQYGVFASYATVGWGAAAIGLFMAGLFGRMTQYRALGLIALGLCVVRVFVVDLDSTLHRIVAFIALGIVLLWVGFSYHRFRHLLTDRGSSPQDPSLHQ